MPGKKKTTLAAEDAEPIHDTELFCHRCSRMIPIGSPYVLVDFHTEEMEWNSKLKRIEIEVNHAESVMAVCMQCQPSYMTFDRVSNALTKAFPKLAAKKPKPQVKK